jgi:hypothetical protein
MKCHVDRHFGPKREPIYFQLPLITDVEQREVRVVVQSSGSAGPSGTIPGTEATPEARASSASDWIANWRSKVRR